MERLSVETEDETMAPDVHRQKRCSLPYCSPCVGSKVYYVYIYRSSTCLYKFIFADYSRERRLACVFILKK